MSRIVAVTSSARFPAHAALAAGALAKVAQQLGHEITIETHGLHAGAPLSARAIAEAELVLLATDEPLDTSRFAGVKTVSATPSQAIRDTHGLLRRALGEATGLSTAPPPQPAPVPAQSASAPAAAHTGGASGLRLVAVTACPTGIAHTFMAARALEKAALAAGHALRVETQGAVGAKSALTAGEIAAAEAVIVAADTKVDLSRFAGKKLFHTSTKHALRAGADVIAQALAAPVPGNASGSVSPSDSGSASSAAPAPKSAAASAYQHLMTGVSHMLPLVVAGGLALALGFALGGVETPAPGSLAGALALIGSGTALQLFVAVLSGYIAFSIADRPGLAPGLVGGMLAQQLGAGFLGGIAAGFLAGYLTKLLATKLPLPAQLAGLKPVLILPFLSTLGVGLAMVFVIVPPAQALNRALQEGLVAMQGSSALAFGALLGAMVAFDIGGPVNKAAYTFAVGLLGSKVYGPMAAVMAAGMTPPLGAALAVLLRRRSFDAEERRASGPAFVLGLSFITEGAIPFAAKDPVRVIPALTLGAAVAGGLSVVSGVTLLVPHGGIFAAVIPGAVSHLGAYLLAIALGTVCTALALLALKRPSASSPSAAPDALPLPARPTDLS